MLLSFEIYPLFFWCCESEINHVDDVIGWGWDLGDRQSDQMKECGPNPSLFIF